MPNAPKKSSAYAEYLYFKIDEYFLKKGSAFTVQEIADYCGLKPTTNLRRRIRHAVAIGTLAVSTALVHDKGHCFVYFRPAPSNGDIPF